MLAALFPRAAPVQVAYEAAKPAHGTDVRDHITVAINMGTRRARLCSARGASSMHQAIIGSCLTLVIHSWCRERSCQLQWQKGKQGRRVRLRSISTDRLHLEVTPPYEIVPVEGKGLGVVATRDITCGERVMADVPIITFKGTDVAWVKSVNKQFEGLSPEKKAAVLALADVEESKTVAGIVRTNNYPRGINSDDGVLCIAFSRFNHSCQPNCEQSWDEDAFQLQAYACTFIAAGEELCTYFVDVRDPQALRRQILQGVYRFRCGCPICVSKDPLVERRLVQMQQLGSRIEAVAARNPERAVRMLGELMELYDLAGIRPNLVRKQACELAVKLLLRSDNFSEAQRAVELAYKFSTLCHGPHHADTLHFAEMLKNGLSQHVSKP